MRMVDRVCVPDAKLCLVFGMVLSLLLHVEVSIHILFEISYTLFLWTLSIVSLPSVQVTSEHF